MSVIVDPTLSLHDVGFRFVSIKEWRTVLAQKNVSTSLLVVINPAD
ncbi:hypothetical protein [Rhodanobacter lindaniclasticus]